MLTHTKDLELLMMLDSANLFLGIYLQKNHLKRAIFTKMVIKTETEKSMYLSKNSKKINKTTVGDKQQRNFRIQSAVCVLVNAYVWCGNQF